MTVRWGVYIVVRVGGDLVRRVGRRNRREELHALDKPIRRPGWRDWFVVDLIIEGSLLIVRGLAWAVGAILKALN